MEIFDDDFAEMLQRLYGDGVDGVYSISGVTSEVWPGVNTDSICCLFGFSKQWMDLVRTWPVLPQWLQIFWLFFSIDDYKIDNLFI